MRELGADLDVTITDCLRRNVFSLDIAAYLWSAVDYKSSILVAGKYVPRTQMLGVLCELIRPNAEVVAIESTPRLRRRNTNWLRLESIPRMYDDFIRSIYPDYVVVEELNAENAYPITRGIDDGFPVIAGIRARSILQVPTYLTSSYINIPSVLVPSYNILTLQDELYLFSKPLIRTTHVAEIVGLETKTNEFIINDAFRYMPESDSHAYSGKSYNTERISKERHFREGSMRDDLVKKKFALKWMMEKNINSDERISEIMYRYYSDPEEFFEEIKPKLV